MRGKRAKMLRRQAAERQRAALGNFDSAVAVLDEPAPEKIEFRALDTSIDEIKEWPTVAAVDAHGLSVGDTVLVDGERHTVSEVVNETTTFDYLDAMGIVALRQAAKPYKIPGAWSMKTDELREAIRAARQA